MIYFKNFKNISQLTDIDKLKRQLNLKKLELSKLKAYSPEVLRKTKKGHYYRRKVLACEVDYPNLLDIIFSHGKTNYKIWFLNKTCKLCLVTKCETIKDDHMVTVIIDVNDKYKRTFMTLDRFLYLVEIGDFLITNRKFSYYYMKPYSQSLYARNIISRVKSEITALEKQIKELESNYYVY